MSSTENLGRVNTSSAVNPWSWRLSTSPWFQRFISSAVHWRPSPELELDKEPLIQRLVIAAEHEEGWLFHPCVNAVTWANEECRLQRDFQLAAWIAAHSACLPGTVMVPTPLWAWSPDGGSAIPPGIYDLGALSAIVAREDCPIALDIWGHSIGHPPDQSWAVLVPSTPNEKYQLRLQVKLFLRALAAMERSVPGLHDWVTAATRVVIPLRRIGTTYSKSSSSRQVPAVAFLTIQDEVQVLEAMVHETAHHYLFLAEAREPLVDPSHLLAYSSPLRPDPRPLVGVLLAFHALAYIGAFYVDALRQDLVSPGRCEEELRTARARLTEARNTLLSNQRFLTDTGRDFFDSTMQVAEYSDTSNTNCG